MHNLLVEHRHILSRYFFGVAVVVALTLLAYLATHAPVLSRFHPMILALVFGMALKNFFQLPTHAKLGISFSQRRALRIGVSLLGIQISFSQIAEVGITGLAILFTALTTTFIFTRLMGRAIGVDDRLCELIASGTAVCGASAIVATNTVTLAPEEDVAYAVASVTLFGSLSMVFYPLLLPLLPLDAHEYGLWVGASIHEVGQVVAAAFQGGAEAGAFGTTSKLVRVIMLAPLVTAIGWWASHSRQTTNTSRDHVAVVPWFVLGFLGFVALNSIVEVDATVRGWFAQVTVFLLTMGLAAIGLETDVSKLRLRGLKPFFLGLCAWIFISTSTLALVIFLY